MWLCLLTSFAGAAFVSEWEVTADQSITLPVSGLFNFTVFWGDGSINTYYSPPVAHTYIATGWYNVTINGPVENFVFNTFGDCQKIINIYTWGEFTVSSTSTGAFAGCTKLQIAATDTPIFKGPGAVLDLMFSGCTSLDFHFNWITTNVTSMNGMFSGCTLLNSPLTFETSNVLNVDSFLADCTLFNSPIYFTTTATITSMASFLSRAVSFNQPIIFDDTSKVLNFNNFFFGAESYNYPVNFDTRSAINLAQMFFGALNFCSFVNFTDTSQVTHMSRLFSATNCFNQELFFDTRKVTNMDDMFSGAVSFNGLLHFDTSKVNSMQGMFYGAINYSQPCVFNTSQVTNMISMFEGASNFNEELFFDTGNVANFDRMFFNAKKFNNKNKNNLFFDTTNAMSMNSMFSGADLFVIDMTWSSNVSDCSNFCTYCGLPNFLQCDPCPPSSNSSNSNKLISSKNWTVCECATGEQAVSGRCVAIGCPSPRYSGQPGDCTCQLPYTGVVTYQNLMPIGCDLCNLTKIGAGLQAGCLDSTSSLVPTDPVVVLSPLVNITVNGSSNGTFVFTLPLYPAALEQSVDLGPCKQKGVRCEWLDPKTKQFQSSGCIVTAENVVLDNGVVGYECTCSHLTVFALVLREQLHQEPLCQADVSDYVLIALYALLSAAILLQIGRLVKVRSLRMIFMVHCVLFLASILRFIFLVAKGGITSVPGLVALGLIPSALSLILFLHLLIAWASLRLFSMASSPFAKLRLPFIVIVVAVCLTSLAIIIACAASDSSSQIAIVLDGSYLLAAMYATVCIMMLWSGIGLYHMLNEESTSSSSRWRSFYRIRVMISTVGLSLSLLLSAALWVAAVQADILESSAATLAVSVLFYVSDWASLCGLTILYAGGVRAAGKKSSTAAISLN